MSEKMAGIIYELRTKRKESQEQVADAIGISRVAYTRYENGTRSPGGLIAMKLARHFGVTIEELFGETGQIKKSPSPEDDEDMRVAQELLRSLRGEKLKEAISHLRWIQSNQ